MRLKQLQKEIQSLNESIIANKNTMRWCMQHLTEITKPLLYSPFTYLFAFVSPYIIAGRFIPLNLSYMFQLLKRPVKQLIWTNIFKLITAKHVIKIAP